MGDDSDLPSNHDQQMQALGDLYSRLRAVERTVNRIEFIAYCVLLLALVLVFR